MLLQDYKGYFYFDTYKGMSILNINPIPRLFTCFFCGICIYLYRAAIPRNLALFLLSVTALVFSSIFTHTFTIIFPIAGTYLLFYIAYSKKIQFYDFAKKGDMSYGVYLYAWPIQQLVLYYLSPDLSLYQLFFISMLITLLIAYFWSWKCIEKPFMELKKAKRLKIPSRLRKVDPVLN
jgi:peptidoglycan/LPS O-acetylase OafA/YrhL